MLVDLSLVAISTAALAVAASSCATSPRGDDSDLVPAAPAEAGSKSEGNNPSFNGGAGDGGPATPAPTGCGKLDVVFAIDSSLSMEEEQENLAKNLPRFVQVLDEYRTQQGRSLDYRIAFTPSAPAFGGGFNRTRGAGAPPGCNPGPNRPWLERTDGDVAQFFGCRVMVVDAANGAQVGGEDMLETALLGITSAITDGSNRDANGEGFLRDDALLALVIITDEDEGGSDAPGKPPTSSIRPMGNYPIALDQVKSGDRRRWAMSVIAGPTACESPGLGKANEAVRLKKLVADVGPKNAVFSSICAGDLAGALATTLGTFDAACRELPSAPVK